MRRAQRLRLRREFAAVYRRGRPYRNELFVLRVLRTGNTVSRVGFTVSGDLGKAVVRNRLKRRLREVVRSLPLAGGCDLVLNARRGAQEAEFRHLREGVLELLGRARLLEERSGAGG